MKTNLKWMTSLAVMFAMFVANAEIMDRPNGIKLTERLTLRPYVAISASYDTNSDRRSGGDENVVWTVNPNLDISYKAEQWVLNMNLYYQYNAESRNRNSHADNNYHGYGEQINFTWSDSLPGERGWSITLSEKYHRVGYTDDMDVGNTTYSRDRQEFKFGGAIQRTFGNGFHADINAGYYWIDYIHSNNSAYGWDRYNVGAEVGYAASPYTDILVAGGYQGYHQDNSGSRYGIDQNNSRGWTLQVGLGSFATQRITYRLLAGWSQFRYGGRSGKSDSGFTYSASGSWKISETWHTMLLASSYYQPSEREQGTSQRVDAISWGIGHSMIRGKLGASLDFAYRRETTAHAGYDAADYDLDVFSVRFGLDYTLNRFLAVFANCEYRNQMKSGGGSATRSRDAYDYDRFRIGVGLRLTY